MRAIKFRAWDRIKKEWLDTSKFAIAGNGLMIGYNQYPDDPNSPVEWSRKYITENIVVTMWTGIVDGNGKEIYEGDIVEYEDWDNGWGHEDDDIEKGKGIVEWGHNSYCGYSWGWTIDEFGTHYSIGLQKQKIKVIGNKFEN